MLRIKQSFGGQFCFQQFKLLLQQAFTRRMHTFGNQLIVTAWLIESDVGAHQHLLTMLRTKGDASVTVAEHSTANLSAIIFQREVPVTGCRLREVGDLGADPDQAHLFLQQLTHCRIETADGKNIGDGWQRHVTKIKFQISRLIHRYYRAVSADQEFFVNNAGGNRLRPV